MTEITHAEATTAHTILLSRIMKSLDQPTRDRLAREIQHAVAELLHDPQAPHTPGVSNTHVGKYLSNFLSKLHHP